ncbi:MAG: MBL fold metallo-hydrolase [Anaerolineae bacterium]|nr:MBL fold metallo-hydrolase [Anaerolineae bacterium]
MDTCPRKVSQPKVRVHYLGHASFVLQFDNGLSVLTDYGSYNAWAEWGWDSPVHDVGAFVPDVTTYSHTHHADHYDESRMPKGISHVLRGAEGLSIGELTISPIRTSEQSLDEQENTSFLFSYKEVRILHLGDCQANMMNIGDAANRAYLESALPQACDLVLMPIEGQSKFIPQGEVFIDLLRPGRVIPMHYWSRAYRDAFLDHLRDQNDIGNERYQIEAVQGPGYVLDGCVDGDAVQVICLNPAPFVMDG